MTVLFWWQNALGASAAPPHATASASIDTMRAIIVDGEAKMQQNLRRVDLRWLLGLPPVVDSFTAARGTGALGRSLRDGVLSDYLHRMRRIAPYARITSTFYEPRPGRLHNGYDIGLDAGTSVPCGWAGRVVRITPWYGNECGITVQTHGIEVTYGHLVPSVKEGDVLASGDIVGHVAYDHVDVKMMIEDEYIDFAVCNPFDDAALTALRAGAGARLTLPRQAAVQPGPRVTYGAQAAI